MPQILRYLNLRYSHGSVMDSIFAEQSERLPVPNPHACHVGNEYSP